VHNILLEHQMGCYAGPYNYVQMQLYGGNA